MAKPVAKLSVSVPADLARDVRKRVGPRGLSGFVANALQVALQHEQLGAYLDQLDNEFGPVPEATKKEVRQQWRKR